MTVNARTTWFWHSLHFALGVCVPLLVLLLMGCKKAEKTMEDLGPEVSGDAIDLALSKAVDGVSLDGIGINQFVEYATTQRLENEEAATVLGGLRAKVMARAETATDFVYTLQIVRSQRMDDNSFETKVTEDTLRVRKTAGSSLLLGNPDARGQLNARALVQAYARAQNSPVKKTTFHNLREFTRAEPPPPRVRMRADCGGLSPCELVLNYIQFDLVSWTSDYEYQKVSLDFAFANNTPFLPFGEGFDQFNGALVTDCRSTSIPITGRTVFVRQCQTLEDFGK